MTRAEQEQLIMKTMADKTLSFGCLTKYYNGIGEQLGCYIGTYDEINSDEDIDIQVNRENRFMQIKRIDQNFIDVFIREENMEIIGHPVYLHNVLMWGKSKYGAEYTDNLYIAVDFERERKIPRDLSKDLYGQSDKTVKALADLILKINGDE